MNLLLCALLALSAVQVQAGDGRIVNGTRVPNRGVYPWLATLEQDGSAYCGGGLP